LTPSFCSIRLEVEARPHFYKSARLLRCGVVKVGAASWKASELGDCSVSIDRQTLESALGLKTEIAEVVEGSNMYVLAPLLICQAQSCEGRYMGSSPCACAVLARAPDFPRQ